MGLTVFLKSFIELQLVSNLKLICIHRFRQGFKNVFCCTCLREDENKRFEEQRYHGAARYSCASEACATDMRVRYNGNGNITLHTVTETLHTNGSGSSAPSSLQPKFSFRTEML